MGRELDISFPSMGSTVRVIADSGREGAVASAREWLERFEAEASRFSPESGLSRLNAGDRPRVPVSPLLRATVAAMLWAARASGGLVDPTLLGSILEAGYRSSLAGVKPAPLREALRAAPRRAPARPALAARWREVRIKGDMVIRPPGVGLDSGGCGKGLAADVLARRLSGCERFLVDAGGDMLAGGSRLGERPFDVHIAHPWETGPAHVVRLAGGALATSGLASRLWRGADGSFAHHLLDPSTGRPAWTGLVSASALAPTALEAETLAKTALLSGPDGARAVLAQHGGVLVRDDGDVEPVGLAAPLPKVRLRSVA